jgi:hypothetical protein
MNHALEGVLAVILVLLGLVVLANLPELRRYARIRKM